MTLLTKEVLSTILIVSEATRTYMYTTESSTECNSRLLFMSS